MELFELDRTINDGWNITMNTVQTPQSYREEERVPAA